MNEIWEAYRLGEDISERLRARWQDCKDPELASLLDRPMSSEPIPGKTVTARTAAWKEVARSLDSADVPRLLSMFPLKTWRSTLDQVERLALFPPDPRITGALIRLLAARPWPTQASVTL